ncbi:MAG: tetratricopeptide repeat protein, partial [Chitinispirillaceae bacterium]|nr:tetratricopeptide repeat protein [Chitinispirillaceae bacterium]
GSPEKALACYLVAWRVDNKNYKAVYGAAKVYNSLNQAENALNMAKKALDLSFTAEASWEYARACIALDRVVEAKSALEKVIESDPGNVIANKELGNIYYNDGQWQKALPLLKKTNKAKPEGELSFKIGKSYAGTKAPDSAIAYLKDAINKGAFSEEATLELARVYYAKGDYAAAGTQYQKVSGGSMTGPDYYKAGMALEKSKNLQAALVSYDRAVSLSGGDKGKEALLAREKVARGHMAKNASAAAVTHLEFIVDADPKAAIVPDGYFLLAEAYQATGKGPRAIASLEKALSLKSKNVEAYARLADLYEKNGMPDKAKKTLETMMSLSPNDPGVYLSLGQYNLKAEKYAEAFKQFERSHALKRSAVAAEGMAVAAYNSKRFDAAADAAETAVSLNPNAWQARDILATLLMQEKKFREAQPHFESLVKNDPGKMEYLEKLSVCYKQTGEMAKLLDLDRQIVARNSQNVESRLRLAKDADAKKDGASAEKFYREIYQLEPKNTDVLYRLYEISLKKKDLNGAAMFIGRYTELRPTAEANRASGDVLYQLKDYDRALTAYRAALKIDPAIKGFHKRYAEIVIAKGQTDEVIVALSGVVKSGEADFGTYQTLGMIYQKKADWRRAIEMYQKALQIDPQSSDALAALAACQAAGGSLSDAVISYEQVVMMDSGAVDALKELADIYAKQGNAAAAEKNYKKYFAKKPDDESVAKRLGKLAGNAGKHQEVIKYLGGLSYKTDEDVEFGLIYAKSCVETKQYKDAIRVLSVLKTMVKPKSAQTISVIKTLAEAYEKDGQESNAAQQYAEYSALPGVFDPDASYKAASLFEKSNPSIAQKIYENNIRQFPNDHRNFLGLGMMLSSNPATLNRAATYLKRTTELAANVPAVWLELGKMYRKMGKEQEELDSYRKYVQTDPQNVEANKRIGIILAKKGQLAEAMIFLEIANTMEPNDPDIMSALAKGYASTNRRNEAIDLLKKAKAKKADDADIRFALFDLYQKTGQKNKAKDEIKELVSMKRDNTFLLQYAHACLLTGDLKAAEAAVEDILATEADNIDVLMLKAKIQVANKLFDEALETYKEISYIDQNHAPSMTERANVYLLQSKIQWAETFFQRALKADSKYALAELGMARVCKIKKDNDCYQKRIDRAKLLDPFNEEIQEEAKKGGR